MNAAIRFQPGRLQARETADWGEPQRLETELLASEI